MNQGQELRGVLSTLLLHYILLEVFLSSPLIVHECKVTNCWQDIMLEAEGSVTEDPKDCSILHIYV